MLRGSKKRSSDKKKEAADKHESREGGEKRRCGGSLLEKEKISQDQKRNRMVKANAFASQEAGALPSKRMER